MKHSSLRVLVVDDYLDSARTAAELVTLWGHEACYALGGLHALELAETFHPDVVLCDLNMPGLDGYELARRLREHPAAHGALLVAVSAYGSEEHRSRSKEAGFEFHLVKPVGHEALRAVLCLRAPGI
jgi:CheY-like chemotaxis protein